MAALNSNMTLDPKREAVVWSKLRTRSQNRQNRQKAVSDG